MYHSIETVPHPQRQQPHDRDRHERKRRYQSCDYCRKRRKACDAASLGIDIIGASNDRTQSTSCTNCRKAGKRCTFQWLHKLPTHNLPRGVRHRLGSISHTSQQSESSQTLERLGGSTLPDNWITPFDSNQQAASDEDTRLGLPNEATTQEQQLIPVTYATEVSPAEYDTTASFSPDTSQYANRNFSANMLHSSFHFPCDNGNNEDQLLAGQLGDPSRPPNSSCSPANL
jgi:hypothetical protein